MDNNDDDTRSEVSNRQPKGDVLGDDLPSALIEVGALHLLGPSYCLPIAEGLGLSYYIVLCQRL